MKKLFTLLKGSPVAIVVVGLVVAGVASAALVNYLSNYVETITAVTSPIEISVNEGRDGSESANKSISISAFGGEDITFTTVAKNKTNTVINGYPVIVVKASGGDKLTGKEFTKVMFEDKNYEGTPIEITDLLYVVHSNGNLEKLSGKTWDNEKLVLFFDNNDDGTPQTYPLTAGEVNWNVLTITLAQNVVGTYEIYSQYANDLAEYAAEQYQ